METAAGNCVESGEISASRRWKEILGVIKGRPLCLWACVIAAIAITISYSVYCVPFLIDDALISYRYSDRLLHGQGLTWNDGEAVEGYSNLLWVLLVAAGGMIHSNLVVVGLTLGLIGNVSVLIALLWTFLRSQETGVFPLAVGLLTLSLSGPFAIWGIGGLETPVFLGLLAWSLGTAYRIMSGRWSWLCPALLLALLSITRPDGILFAAGLSMALIIREGISRPVLQRAVGVFLIPLLFFLAQICFRLAYYGSPVPNTAYVKLAFTLHRALIGAAYVGWGALVNIVPLVAGVAAVITLWRMRHWHTLRDVIVFVLPGLVWLSYVAAIGGDVFPWNRHWLPALVCFTFALTRMLSSLSGISTGAMATVLSLGSALHLGLQIAATDNFYSADDGKPQIFHMPSLSLSGRYEQDCMRVGRLLREAFQRQQPVVAVNVAGCIPYASRLPSIDMLGLNDYHIAHHRPPDMGQGTVGHELGDGAYVLARKPDFVQFGAGIIKPDEPIYRSDKELAGMTAFKQLYRLLYFDANGAMLAFWVRIEDSRIGIVRTQNDIYIPGFLLATTPQVRARLDSKGKLVADLEGGEATLENIYVPAGTWEISLVTAPVNRLRLIASAGSSAVSLDDNRLRLLSDGTLRTFKVIGAHGLIYAITAKRLPNSGDSGATIASGR